MRTLSKKLLILFCFFVTQCTSETKKSNVSTLTYDYSRDGFKIIVPKNWKYVKEQGEDSFTGCFVDNNDKLWFDCSKMGYANHLDELANGEHVIIDSTDDFVTKTVWPKIVGKGLTGIYIHSRKSSLNFQMNGKNLSEKNQELALKAFKTISLKNQ
jgi:hypothetical protein